VKKEIKSLIVRVISSISLLRSRRDIVFFDSIFPHPLSSFRLAEFTYLLHHYPNSRIYVNGSHFNIIKEKRSLSDIINDFLNKNSSLRGRVIKYSKFLPVKARLAYCVFLNDMFSLLPVLERTKTPFVFTLYPGGGFKLNDNNVDDRLARIFTSPQFKAVIVTQPITRSYLLQKEFCSEDKIKFIYGAVFNSALMHQNVRSSKEHLMEVINVVFVAHKYMPEGRDKGYDLFIETAKILYQRDSSFRFHVVGNFDENDFDILGIETVLKFHGSLLTHDLVALYQDMDIFLSPNRPFTLAPGAFDGFPTGAAVEAAMAGVALFVSDPLSQNQFFRDKKELAIIPNHDPAEIASLILNFMSESEGIKVMAGSGKKIFSEIFDIDYQMKKRIDVLNEALIND
jgi:glycosyltransferase involved in cell wall biosynthesis